MAPGGTHVSDTASQRSPAAQVPLRGHGLPCVPPAWHVFAQFAPPHPSFRFTQSFDEKQAPPVAAAGVKMFVHALLTIR